MLIAVFARFLRLELILRKLSDDRKLEQLFCALLKVIKDPSFDSASTKVKCHLSFQQFLTARLLEFHLSSLLLNANRVLAVVLFPTNTTLPFFSAKESSEFVKISRISKRN